MLTDDAITLSDDPRLKEIRDAILPFEQIVIDRGLPDLRPRPEVAVVHSHCHTRANGSGDALRELVEMIPELTVRPSGAGCCGMAGAFGYEHPELSRQIAEMQLLPAARTADVVVAHGASCRQQIADLADRPTLHPAVLIAAQLPHTDGSTTHSA
jgi:Fe-S oxidoreductase